VKKGWKGIAVAIVIGVAAVWIKSFAKAPILDPLVAAMVIGILLRSFVKFGDEFKSGFSLAPLLFIPVGVILYGACNLNFVKFAAVDTNYIFMLFIVFIVYVISALLLANAFGLNEKTGYLIATGSAICGASAIAITSRSINAEADDVSNSLIPVFLSALIGLFVVLPLLASYLKLTEVDYGVFSGTILQFTGFVKAAVAKFPKEVKTIALSVKAVRYVGLLLLIPLFASFVKGRFYVPWYLFAFLGAGLVFSFMPEVSRALRPVLKLTLNVLWSIAMAAVGLNASVKGLVTKNGLKAFGASFISFMIAAGVFLLGIKFM